MSRLLDVRPVHPNGRPPVSAGLVPIVGPPDAALARLAVLYRRFEANCESSRAPSTQRAYASDFRRFHQWCSAHGISSLPASPAAVALYLTDLEESYKVATIGRHMAAIAREHRKGALPSPLTNPLVKEAWQSTRRRLGVKQDAKVAILTADLRGMLQALTDSTIDIRDRALLLVGFAGAFRRSELVSLDVADLRFVDRGLEIMLHRSKTDQEGEGRLIGVPYGSNLVTCPGRALQAWLRRSAIVAGPLFRAVDRGGAVAHSRLTAQTVALIVKRHAQRLGLDPVRYAGHSLRAGFVTSAALAGADALEISRQTGHRSLAMVQRYTRPATIWQQNPAQRVGL
jgi:site-specific recombinase XerD